MSKLTRNVLITLLLLALMPAIHAFESTLIIEGGVGIPLDDITGTDEMKGAWALAWDAWIIKDWMGVGVSPWIANIEVQGDDPTESYFSSLEGINLYLKLRPTKAGALNFKDKSFIRRISPFIALGGGWSTHGSKDETGVSSNPNTQPGFRGHFTLPHAAAGISFLSSWNTTMDLGVKYDLFTQDNIDLTENGSMNDAILTPYVGLGLHFGTKKPVPEIMYVGLMNPFTTVVGTPSNAQGYKLQGKNLRGDVKIVAPEGFEISIDAGKTYAKSVVVPAAFADNIWVRLTGAKTGNFDGSIGHKSEGAADASIPVTGIVKEAALPTLTLVSSGLGAFSTELGTPSAPQSYRIKGSNLTGDINITAPEGFEFSLDGGKTYARSMKVPAGFDKDIMVRMTGAKAGDFSGNISHASDGAITYNLPVMGTVIQPGMPTILVSGANLTGFSTVVGTPSAAQSYKLEVTNLTGEIYVVAPEAYEFSTDGGKTYFSSAYLPKSFGGNIQVRLTGAKAGKFGGNIVHSSDGAKEYKLPVSGVVAVPETSGLDLLEQDLLKHIVHFDTNLYTIREDDKPFLDRVAESLKKLPEVMIEIQGHTDNTGTDKINEPLSYNRAKVVRDYLVARSVGGDQIEIKGYSSKQPIATNNTVDGRQENRRAQMVLIK